MLAQILILAVLFSPIFGFGHGSDKEEAEETWANLNNLLRATFVEIERETEEKPRPGKFLFVDLQGNYYSVQKSVVAEAIGRSIATNLKAHCKDGHCHGHEAEAAKARWQVWRDRVLSFFLAPVYGAKEMAVQLPPTIALLAGEFGVIPAWVVTAISVPYTISTEALESMVMGMVGMAHLHWACPLFQVIYWGPMSLVLLNLGSLKEAATSKIGGDGVWKKLKNIFSDKFKEWQFKRLIRDGIEAETTDPDVPSHTGGHTFPNLKGQGALHKLYAFIRSELQAAQEAGKITYWDRVKALVQAGRIKALLNSLRHSRWLAVQAKDSRFNSWIPEAETAITGALREFWLFAGGESSLDKLKEAVTAAGTIVYKFRGSCALELETPIQLPM